MKNKLKKEWKFILLIVIMLFIRLNNIFVVNIVQGTSMYPTLKDKQVVLGTSIKSIERGRVVVAKKEDHLVIKRVIGLPNEFVECKDGVIYIDGEEYKEEYVVYNEEKLSWSYQIGENEYLIVGDNRDNSYDSRYYGPISKENIKEVLILDR